jgi:hypothetical protein
MIFMGHVRVFFSVDAVVTTPKCSGCQSFYGFGAFYGFWVWRAGAQGLMRL